MTRPWVVHMRADVDNQEATEVTFRLHRDRLQFSHNGKSFLRQDVENITGIGNSDKPSERNKIGRFGIGFKSVFVVTRTPRVYCELESLPFAFKIVDLVVPERLDVPKGYRSGNTYFILTFDRQNAVDAYQVIRTKLQSLGADVMLFLKHIEAIHWTSEEHSGHYTCQRDNNGLCQLSEESLDQFGRKNVETADYLRFRRSVDVSESDRDLEVSLAFRLEDGRIVREPRRTSLNVFFPTEEDTHVRFRMHAPMLLTDNRANVKRGNHTNDVLMQHCAELLHDSLVELRRRHMITISALSCLPIRKDDFQDSPFQPLYLRTLHALQTEDLLPTADGGFTNANCARIARGTPLRKLLSDEQLTRLLDRPMPIHWLSDEITEDKTRDLWSYLRQELEISEIDPERFGSRISKPFLEEQSDQWVIEFYKFLLTQEALWRKEPRGVLRNKSIIRVEDGHHEPPFSDDGLTQRVFMPSDAIVDGKRTVRGAIVRDEEACRFLTALGLEQPDLVDEVVNYVLPKYRAGSASLDTYAAHIDQMARAFDSCHGDRKGMLRDLVLGTPCIYATNAANAVRHGWKKPGEVFAPSEDAKTWFAGNAEAWFISDELQQMRSWARLRSHLSVPMDVGIRSKTPDENGNVAIRQERGDHQRGLQGFDPGSDIPGISHVLRTVTVPKALILWNCLLKSPDSVSGVVETSTRGSYENSNRVQQLSLLGRVCTSTAWLPNAKGTFQKPGSLLLTDLPPDFQSNGEAAWRLADVLRMKQSGTSKIALENNIPPAALEGFIKAYKRDPESTQRWISDQINLQFPVVSIPDPGRRESKIRDEIPNRPKITSEMKNRSVRVPMGMRADNRAYLQNQYTNSDGRMICQICRKEMPFKLPNGDYYFESVQCVANLAKAHPENRLALCPLCAAMYCYAKNTSNDALIDAVLSAEGLVIPVVMAGNKQSIRFVESHLLDLRVILRDERQKR